MKLKPIKESLDNRGYRMHTPTGYPLDYCKTEYKYKNTPDYKLAESLGTNGLKWAEAYCEIHNKTEEECDNLFGWFCNAIEITKDITNRENESSNKLIKE